MRTASLALVSATLLAAGLAAPASAETKIASINTPLLQQQAPQLKAAEIKFKSEFDKRDQDLQSEKKKFQEDVKKAQREADTMSAQQKATLEKSFIDRRSDLEQKDRALTEEAQKRNGELLRSANDQIMKALNEVAQEKGLDLVVRDPAWASDAVDITQEVLKKLASMPNESAPADEPKKKKKK